MRARAALKYTHSSWTKYEIKMQRSHTVYLICFKVLPPQQIRFRLFVLLLLKKNQKNNFLTLTQTLIHIQHVCVIKHPVNIA